MGRLDGKVAIITGASTGMGQAAAILFANEGARVVVADWASEGGEETVKMIRQAGGEAIFVKTDVSKTEDVKNMIKTGVDTYGKLNILYNNAAIVSFEPLTELTEENFTKVINVNLKGVWLGMKYAIPEMVKAGGGSIVNTASIAADKAQLGLSVYSASKGGVISISRVAAIENAAHNIRVNVIKPGPTMTSMFQGAATGNPELLEQDIRETPLGKLGQPEEVAQLALFLASDESSHITGTKITIDGGIEADNRRIA